MKSKSEEKKETVQSDPEQAKPQPKFRYQCHGCTNDALLSENPTAGMTITCPVCGKVQETKSENWIAL